MNSIVLVMSLIATLCLLQKQASASLSVIDQPPKIWALLVAGSNGWDNYRHQADVCHAYHVLRSNGIPADHIITMMYDDIANNELNPYPGKIFNRLQGDDVYEGVAIDYSGDAVTAKNFLQILQGHKSKMSGIGTGRVIESGPNDHIFVYLTDHGGNGFVCFPHQNILSVKALNDALQSMHNERKYNQLLFYMEACESGSMFENVLPDNTVKVENIRWWKLSLDSLVVASAKVSTSESLIYAVTASNGYESSWASDCDNDMQLPCMGDVFSVNWMQDSNMKNLKYETLQRQYEFVRLKTNTSHVQHYGNLSIAFESVADFQGWTSRIRAANGDYSNPSENAWPVHDIPLLRLQLSRQRLLATGSRINRAEKIMEINKQISSIWKKRTYLRYKMDRIANATTLIHHSTEHRRRILDEHPTRLTQLQCHETVTKIFNSICFPFAKNPYARKYVYVLSNLCEEESLTTELIVQALLEECREGENSGTISFDGGIE